MIVTSLAALLLAAPAPIAPAAYVDRCGARSASRLVGSLISEARRAVRGRREVRFICPTCKVTFDLRPRRLNIEFDAAERVTTVRCG